MAGGVLLLARGRGKEHVAGKADRAAPFSSSRDCDAAGIANQPQRLATITGREAGFGLQTPRIAPEQQAIAPLSPGDKHRSEGKAALAHSLLTSPSSQLSH